MDSFDYRGGSLHCELVAIDDIAAGAGTPAYIYSKATLLRHYRALADAFAPARPTVCFSIKSLANVHILRLLAEAGSGFDVVSGGELARARAAGADMNKVVFAGVGKTDREISDAIAADIRMFNVESEAELGNLARIARAAGKVAHAALRVNPDVYDPRTHAYTATGKKATKFGVDIDHAADVFRRFVKAPGLRLDAIHLHIGSPIYSAEPYVRAVTKALELVDALAREGIEVRALNIGGGFAADYEKDASPMAADYAGQILPLLQGRQLELLLEPGRQIACNSGLLVTRVLYTKMGGGKRFIIADAAMTDLIRPAIYDARHFIWPVRLPAGAQPPSRRIDQDAPGLVKADVVGGVCESTDALARDRMLPPVDRGDLLAVFSAGAYGFTMSSQYNSRPRAPEILVDGSQWRVIRRRETHDDLMAAEMEV
jgi:diaminopimelate decarboxylase